MKKQGPTEPYIPNLGIVYPDKPDEHMVAFRITGDINLDTHYPFLDKSFGFKVRRALVYLIIFTLALPMSTLLFGLKIEGRNILRKYRKILRNGAMTISNHVHRWDFVFMLSAVRTRSMYFPVWKEQLRSPDKNLIRAAGGIPVPDEIRLIKYFNQAFDEICARKKWIHSYPESCRFDYFQPIRPFKKGVFTMAHRYNLPVLPLAYSYRPPHFPFTIINLFRSVRGKQKLPMITLRIGEPLLFDTTLPRREAVQKMRRECHETVVRLAGIQHNPYPAEGD